MARRNATSRKGGGIGVAFFRKIKLRMARTTVHRPARLRIESECMSLQGGLVAPDCLCCPSAPRVIARLQPWQPSDAGVFFSSSASSSSEREESFSRQTSRTCFQGSGARTWSAKHRKDTRENQCSEILCCESFAVGAPGPCGAHIDIEAGRGGWCTHFDSNKASTDSTLPKSIAHPPA